MNRNLFLLSLITFSAFCLSSCDEETVNPAQESSEPGGKGTDASEQGLIVITSDAEVNNGIDGGSNSDPNANGSASANVSLTSFQGFEERYIMTSDDDPVDVCRVRYELHAVEEPSFACDQCSWDVVVERRNPNIIIDVDNACENSDLALDASIISAIEGERIGYGYVYEFVGHSNVLMWFNPELSSWEAVTFANWSEDTGELFYDRRDGFCSYGGNQPEFENSGICGLSGEAVVSD